jgi:O-antigen/teichoic acid export membrane protein
MPSTARDVGVADTSLDQSLVRGIAWTGIVKWTTQIVSWVGTLATVRLLAPTDYGLFGMAMVYVGFGQIVTEAGISAAVIQRPALADAEARELAGMSVVVGVLFSIITLAIAAPLAAFYSQPAVLAIVVALSPVFVIRSFQLVPRAMLTREMRFRSIALVEVLESLALVVTTLVLALAEWSYWALVFGSLASAIVATIVLVWRRWVRPTMPTALIKGPVRFTWQVTVSQVAWYAYTNADFAVVGRVLGSVSLGAYSFAWNIANIAGERVSALVGRVTPPLFAAAQNDPPTLRRYLAMVLEGIAILTLPASIGMALVADEFVPIVAGQRWEVAVQPLRILAVYAAFRSIFYLTPQVLIATGRARTSMRFGLLATLVLPPAFIVGSLWGTTGVALAWVVVYPALALATFVRATLAATGMSWLTYWLAMWPALRATVLMALVVIAVRAATPDGVPGHFALAMHVMVGAVTYAALVGFALRTRLKPLLTTIRSSVARKREGDTDTVFSAGTPSSTNRLILISYHFAPSSAVGALRWQKMVRLAAERGWEFDVVACAPAELRSPDPSRWDDLPAGSRVYGVATRPLAVLRFTQATSRLLARLKASVHTNGGGSVRAGSLRMDTRTWLPKEPRDLLRACFAWMDLKLENRWAEDAARVATAIHEPGVHRAVITCGPPHEAHLAGVAVAERTGLPLILDFRDPWSLIQRLPEAVASRAWLSVARKHEELAVNAASLIVTNTAPLRAAMQRLYPGARRRIVAITNGCDDEPLPRVTRSTRFTIGYAGSIYLDRNPRPLFEAVARAVGRLGVTPDEFGIELMGDVERFDGVSLRSMAADAGMEPFLVLHSPQPRAAAIAFLAQATVLVVLPQDSHLAIPAKLFDYMRHDAWLLAITERTSATAQLLEDSGADVVAPGDPDRIADAIVRRYIEFRAGKRGIPLASNPVFTRRAQADRLFNFIEVVAGVPRQEPAPLCAAS